MGTRTTGFTGMTWARLRGVAITLVAVFHVWFGRVSTGRPLVLALSGLAGGKNTSLRPQRICHSRLRSDPTPSAGTAPGTGCGLAVALLTINTAADAVGSVASPEPGQRGITRSVGVAHGLNYLRAGEAVSPLHIGLCRCRVGFYLAFLLVAGCAYFCCADCFGARRPRT